MFLVDVYGTYLIRYIFSCKIGLVDDCSFVWMPVVKEFQGVWTADSKSVR